LSKSAVYVTVGFGYAIRASFGAWLAGHTLSAAWIGAIALLASFLGTMFVTMTWVLEGTAFIPSNEAAPAKRYREELRAKPHFGPLMHQAGLLEADAKPAASSGTSSLAA